MSTTPRPVSPTRRPRTTSRPRTTTQRRTTTRRRQSGGGGGLLLVAVAAAVWYGFPHSPDASAAADTGAGPAAPAKVKHWVAEANQIMIEHGTPASKLDAAGQVLMIEHESAGNPNAVNHWDSNAQAGHPSKGLMQTITTTFDAYALPGHGLIFDPVDNIIAGSLYAIARYHSIDNVPGVRRVHEGLSYVGY